MFGMELGLIVQIYPKSKSDVHLKFASLRVNLTTIEKAQGQAHAALNQNVGKRHMTATFYMLK